MDNEKNISLVIKQPEEEDKKIAISFSTIFAYLRKYLLLWIIAAVIIFMFTVSGVTLLKTTVADTTITALVNFNYEGIELGLDPYGEEFDVNKIKSPNIIETALSELNEPLTYVEAIRKNIAIKGIIPDEDMERISVYKGVYMSGATAAALSAADKLLSTGFNPTYYVISLNYGAAGLSLNQSKLILDEVLKSYQDYFFTTYGYNQSLGTSVIAVDYKDYDYSAAIDVFSETLTNLNDYVKNLAASDPTFRSGKTGYSFKDLNSTIETLKSAELDSLSSYVIINNVTSDKELLLTYYEYKIEQLERNQNVYKAELDSISKSIETYEKDTMLIYGDGVDSENNSFTQTSETYDDLIEQKVAKQNQLSRCKQDITYFDSRVSALKRSKGTSSDEMKQEVETRLANVYTRVNELIEVVNETSDEYYETVTFAKAYNILVPASGSEPTVVTSDLLLPIIVAEALVSLVYFGLSIVNAVVHEHKSKKTETETAENAE